MGSTLVFRGANGRRQKHVERIFATRATQRVSQYVNNMEFTEEGRQAMIEDARIGNEKYIQLLANYIWSS